MAREIQIVKPNLFLAKGVYGNGGEVYFSLGDGNALKEASMHVDSVVAENIGQLRIGINSQMGSDSLASLVYHTIMSQSGNFKATLHEFLENFKYDRRQYFDPANLGESIERRKLPLVLWDPDLDPREILYARTDTPENTEAYTHLSGVLKDFEKWAAELETEELVTIDRGTTREAMERRLAELSGKVSDQRAVYHVVHGEMPCGQWREHYPVGRVSVYPLKADDEKKVERVLEALAEGLAKFDGPKLSVDNAPQYLHALKELEPTIEAIARRYGRFLRITGAQKKSRLLFQE